MKPKKTILPTIYHISLTEAEIGHIIIALNYIGNDTLVSDNLEELNTIAAKLALPLAYKAID